MWTHFDCTKRPKKKNMKWVDGVLILLAIATGWVWLKTPGYLFLLDYVTGPAVPPSETKILIILALLIAGISAAHLAKRIAHSTTIAVSCGMFYMFNPFVFNRIFMGHLYLLFGYALMPLMLLLILKYITMPSLQKAIWIGGIATLIIFISIHYSILLPIVVLFFILQYRSYISKKISRTHIAIMALPPISRAPKQQ